MEYFWYGVIFILGAIIGSFLNVVATQGSTQGYPVITQKYRLV